MNIQAKRYNTFWKLKIVNAQILKLVIPHYPDRYLAILLSGRIALCICFIE